jgi:hypothetical protein
MVRSRIPIPLTTVGVGSVIGTFKDVKAGWAGAGIEGALGGGWTAKLEYLFGKTENTIATPGLGTLVTETRRYTDNIVHVGLNYKWGGGQRLLIADASSQRGRLLPQAAPLFCRRLEEFPGLA